MRKFPKAGFYVYKDSTPDQCCMFVSGTTKGNFYRRPETHSPNWNKLLWTCVDSQKELDEHYVYYETNPTSLELPNNE
jgi:hypothetical protein